MPGPAARSRCASDWYSKVRGFDRPVRQLSFVVIGHEIISTAIHSYRWFKWGSYQLRLDMMIDVDWWNKQTIVFINE